MEITKKKIKRIFFDSVRKRPEYFIHSEDTVLSEKLNYLCSTVYYLLRFWFAFDETEAY